MGSLRFIFIGFFPSLFAAAIAPAKEPLSIAAAASFLSVLEPLAAAFTSENPDVAPTIASGASGTIVAQITEGAPYDVFLSADLEYPRRLAAAGHAADATLTTFARGRLVLWTTNAAVPLRDISATLRDSAVRKVAIANPETAPYGDAARQTLQNLGAWSAARAKIVNGENITQTAQFVETGNADAGFVALSIVLSPALKTRGRWIEVPADLHAPLDHGAILTKRGENHPAAKRFLDFLGGAPAREILVRYGYGVPVR